MSKLGLGFCAGMAALLLLTVSCSESEPETPTASPSTPVVQATQPPSPAPSPTPTPPPPPPGGAIPGATPSTNYVPLPSPAPGAISTVFPPVTVRDPARASWTPAPREAQGQSPAKPGAIEGALSYPSSGLPAGLIACAESIEFGETYCTGQRTMITHPDRGLLVPGYQLLLPPGRYYVYSEVLLFPLRAYYSLHNICGSHIACPSHDPIIVVVKSDQLLKGVDPGDWYAWPP